MTGSGAEGFDELIHGAQEDVASLSRLSPMRKVAAKLLAVGVLSEPAQLYARSRFAPQPRSFSCRVAYVHDGDTFRCTDGTRIRVAGIDARELDGSCARGHPCAKASAGAATAILRRVVERQTLKCTPEGTSYNRIAAWCYRSDGTDVSCTMMESGTVARWDRFWRGHRC
jgi:endonuclease YncB( thermonuclease family)